MSADVTSPPASRGTAAVRASSKARTAVFAAIALVGVFSLVRILTGADDLTSSGTVSAALGTAVPLALAGVGGIWSERAGVANIGLEGMMILGTFGGGWLGWQYGPWAGIAGGVLLGAVGGLVHAVATVSLGVDHIVSGVAINILVGGAARFAASILFVDTPGGGTTQSPKVDALGGFSVPGVEQLLHPVEATHWFVVSDLAGLVIGVTTDVSWLTLITLLLIGGTAWVLWRTPFGLRLRSCGEDPWAAESLGVNVYLYKYVGVVASGAFAGLGGAYLSVVAAQIYREGQTGGRGYIGLAAMLFGNWRPGSMLAGSALFGYTDAMQLRNAAAEHAILLVFALGAVAWAVQLLRARSWVGAGVAVAAAAGLVVWFLTTDEVPSQFAAATPYVATLLVIAALSQKLRTPKADGLVYRKGEAR